MPDVTDYGPTIADLERKRDEIDRTIAMLRALSGMPAIEPSTRNGSGAMGPVEFTNKHFFGMKAPEAVILYLETVKEARTAARMAQDLMEHGFITTSDSPANTIRTTLRRLESTGDVVQVKKEWGLPAWYPGLRRISKPESGIDTEGRRAQRPARKQAPKARSGVAKKAAHKGANAYQKFVGEQMAKGLDMKAAAAAWHAQKEGR